MSQVDNYFYTICKKRKSKDRKSNHEINFLNFQLKTHLRIIWSNILEQVLKILHERGRPFSEHVNISTTTHCLPGF